MDNTQKRLVKENKLKKIDFLDLNDMDYLKIKVNNIGYAKDVNYIDGKFYAVKKGGEFKLKQTINELFKAFVKLGKETYNLLPNEIEKINYKTAKTICIEIHKYDRLILKKDILKNKKIVQLIEGWCKEFPVVFINSNLSESYTNGCRIEVFTLLDIAVFTYLVLSALNNQRYLRLIENGKKEYQKEFNNGNKITFDSFINTEGDSISEYYGILSNILSEYQYSHSVYYKPDAKDIIEYRPLLQETTDLTYNTNTYKWDLCRKFENIYSLFFLLLKVQIYAYDNNHKIFSVCNCGEIIEGKADLCENCRKRKDRERKRKQLL